MVAKQNLLFVGACTYRSICWCTYF